MDTPVLIVGAGPTGLTLALFLAHQGIRARVVDRAPEPGLTSRAMAVQARTLEFYQQIGLAEEVVSRGIEMGQIHLYDRGSEVALIRFSDLGEKVSPYPFALSFPQDEHERLLTEELAKLGVQVERNTELTAFEEDSNGVRATLRKGDVTEETACIYICGCDGAHSAVRQILGLGFPGGTYSARMFVADVSTPGMEENHEFRGVLNDPQFLARFPIRTSGMSRFIGVLPENVKDREKLTYEDVRGTVEHALQMKTGEPNWFSVYKVHHRVAAHFRVGRAFLCGDSGHIHSPAGGQGMNTGIGDSVNLAWKLAALLQGRGNALLLDTYEPERMRFAKGLVASTDRAFTAVSDEGWLGKVVREVVFPHLVPLFMGLTPVRTAAFKVLSQTTVNYHGSALSEGHMGHIQGGDRLPWVRTEAYDNFEPLRSLDWQVHVYGSASFEADGVPVQRFEWVDEAERAGLTRDAVYLVRPDGYVGWVGSAHDLDEMKAYIGRFGVKPRT